MSIKGIIFDFNGTLLWDTQLHNIAWDNFFREHGFCLSDEEKHKKMHGRLNKEIIAELFGEGLTKEEIKLYGLEKEREYRRMCTELEDFSLAAGVADLFEKLKEKELPFVIATASGIENVNFYMEWLKLDRWFRNEHIIYNDGSMRGKPFPDLFLKALEVLGLKGKDTMIFEDSVAGIKAAEAAGAGRIVIVNSNDGDYSEFGGRYPIIRDFSEVKWDWFEDK